MCETDPNFKKKKSVCCLGVIINLNTGQLFDFTQEMSTFLDVKMVLLSYIFKCLGIA